MSRPHVALLLQLTMRAKTPGEGMSEEHNNAFHECLHEAIQDQGCPMGYPYGSVKIFPRPKLHIRMQIKMPQNLAIY